MTDTVDTSLIERGWSALTTDGYRVGDVTEVHPTYLLVSRGLIFVSDTYVPLHAVEKVEDGKIRLAVTRTTLRRMDWKKPPRTPLELVRAEDDDSADDESLSSIWGNLLNDEEPAQTTPNWEASGDEITPESETSTASGYWDSSTGLLTSNADDEGYDTMGIVTGQRLEAEGGIGLAIQDVGFGRPIVLLHDWLLNQAYWDGLVPRLVEQGYRVVTMDWRGHGASDRPWNEYWLSLLVHDLRTLIRTLDLDPTTIVGHGLGAAVAIQYAATYQHAGTRRLILVNPAAPRFVAAEDFPHGLDDAMVEGWIERLRVDRPSLVRHFVGALLPCTPLDDATTQWLWDIAMRAPVYPMMQTLFALRMLDVREELARLSVPTTVMQGTEDQFTPPALGQAVAQAVAGAEYLPFEGAGHLLGLESRDMFEEALLRILEKDAEADRDAVLTDAQQEALQDTSPEADVEGDSAESDGVTPTGDEEPPDGASHNRDDDHGDPSQTA